jgi:hypothetical protein
MIQRRSRPRFQQKSIQSILIARKLWRQKLQRHLAPEVKVLRLIHYPHPATAQLAGNAVMRDGLSNHALLAQAGGVRDLS